MLFFSVISVKGVKTAIFLRFINYLHRLRFTCFKLR